MGGRLQRAVRCSHCAGLGRRGGRRTAASQVRHQRGHDCDPASGRGVAGRPPGDSRQPLRGSDRRDVGEGGVVGERAARSPGAMTSSTQSSETIPPSFWQTIREAIRGTHHDYTAGPIGRAIILLAVPMVLEMMMESLFAVADIFWLGHVSPRAVAKVGLAVVMLVGASTAWLGFSVSMVWRE